MSMPLVQWLAPQPMWKDLAANVTAVSRPEILQFSTDMFMEDFLGQMEKDPAGLARFKATPETWRGDTSGELKLYHPAHQRHYLVTASVVCQTNGLPDRTVNNSRQESVFFVLRRIAPVRPGATEKAEYAFVLKGEEYVWTPVINRERTSARSMVPGEEKLALFPVMYEGGDKKRRVYAGTIPVGQRETYDNSLFDNGDTGSADGPATTSKTSRKILFINDVRAPWENLIESALTLGNSSDDKEFEEAKEFVDEGKVNAAKNARASQKRKTSLVQTREQLQTGSWYVLLDFAKYLKDYLPGVWRAIDEGNVTSLTSAERALLDALEQITFDATLSTTQDIRVKLPFLSFSYTIKTSPIKLNPQVTTLARAIKASHDNERRLETVIAPFDMEKTGEWPDFMFPLADPPGAGDPSRKHAMTLLHNGAPLSLDRLTQLIVNALPDEANRMVPAMPLAARLGQQGRRESEASTFVIRTVFKCSPRCQPFQKDAVSQATQPFKMAGFFDPDAPARDITITLPEDPTPAGLRKYAKNTAMVMSDALSGRVTTMKKVTFMDLVRSVLPWPFHKDLPVKTGDIGPCKDGGKVCALSIPIVTLCAMFLLIMIVLILDYLFRWIPWLMSCFSLSKFIGKR